MGQALRMSFNASQALPGTRARRGEQHEFLAREGLSEPAQGVAEDVFADLVERAFEMAVECGTCRR
ncbi:MAG: hypothetical protein COS95_06110 [Ignavibacteriales bacterium CG07_land_8_20_14_0_80_59_12]|nr:MAG: hypothetical protein COS95_06110 [Ignavibacteriales bacterium CG07_land_8_20_14_0_80_59_12]